jgi:glycosyltransferase involved in cell wall biosynthesis
MSDTPTIGSRPSVCFVALNAYNLLSGRDDIDHIGGAEVQQVRIASWLVSRGFHVSFVTLDHGQPDGLKVNGITVRKAYVKERGIRGLRFIHPRWSGLWAAMTRADADVYYQRGAGSETGQVALWCRTHRRPFVFAAANESDCCRSLYALGTWRERTLYRVGLRLADAVTAQTATQQAMLRQNIGLTTTLIRNCGWYSMDDRPCKWPALNDPDGIRVLWVGRISEQKRFEWLLDIAEKCPEMTFDVVGAANGNSEYASRLMERAAKIPNVKMNGQVPYAEMAGYYRKCRILCCTSAYEGFPNTFLESWALGAPVVSTFDPDGIIASNGLGWVVQDVDGAVTHLKEIIQSPEIWLAASKAAQQYYLANHTADVCLPGLEQLLLKLAERGG